MPMLISVNLMHTCLFSVFWLSVLCKWHWLHCYLLLFYCRPPYELLSRLIRLLCAKNFECDIINASVHICMRGSQAPDILLAISQVALTTNSLALSLSHLIERGEQCHFKFMFLLVFLFVSRWQEESTKGTSFDERIQFGIARHTRYEQHISSSGWIHVTIFAFRQRKLRLLRINICRSTECQSIGNNTTT